MGTFIRKEGYSVVSLVIPQARLNNCLSVVLGQWPYEAIHFDCRGTMVREHWIQSFLPIMNPECEYLQFLVNDDDLNEFVQALIQVNNLHLPGSGAIFTSRCVNYATNTAEPENPKALEALRERSVSPANLKDNLYAIFALIQSGRTDNAIKAAMHAGSHGPIVYFVEGRGTRDKIGWLKITKKPYEEVVMVLVEDIDRARVKDALVSAGRVNTLGGGMVFEMPIESGLVNLPTSISNKNRLASNEQIIAAVDQLMGNTDWRDTRSLNSLMDKTTVSTQQGALEKNSALCALMPRKYANEFLDHMLDIGMPGGNINYTKLFASDDDQNDLQLAVHHELAQVRMVLPANQCADHFSELQTFISEQGYSNVTLYELEVEGLVRYKQKPKVKIDAVYRGAATKPG